jgi:hypothetical protein
MNKDYFQYEKYYEELYGEIPSKYIDTFVEYFKGDERHRVGGPAFVSRNERSYWRNDLKHRLNATAQYLPNYKYYYEFGRLIKTEYV